MHAIPPKSNRAAKAIFWGGLACGVFDITQAIVAWHFQTGAKPIKIWQAVAGGVLGARTFQGGLPTAILGGALHFLIAFTAAAVYWFASRKLRFMVRHAVIAGLLYGETVWAVMNFVVLPLSAAHPTPLSIKAALVTGPIGHPLLVGLPIALVARHFSRNDYS